VKRLLLFWFGCKDAVSAKSYLRSGMLLAALKGVAELALVYAATGKVYGFHTYFFPRAFPAEDAQLAPAWLLWTRLLLNLPFVWITLSMSIRRARDAALSPFVGFMVLIPVLNIFAIVPLCVMGSVAPSTPFTPAQPTPPHKRSPRVRPLFPHPLAYHCQTTRSFP
jgi:uncharacterized membrane protein YhaH (DUF805 family)